MKNLPLSLTVSAAAGAFTLLDPADWSPVARRAFIFGPGALAATGVALAPFPGDGVLAAEAGTVDATRGDSSADDGAPDDGAPGDAGTGTSGARAAVARAALAVGAGAAVSGVQVLSLRLDAGMERWLVRHGVAAPRLWMAAAVALATLGTDLLQETGGSSDRGRVA